MPSPFEKIVGCIFIFNYGLLSLASVWLAAVIRDGALWAHDTKEEKSELAAGMLCLVRRATIANAGTAQKKYWSLDKEPIPGFRHAFFENTNGTRLHYVVNVHEGNAAPKNVIFFIHGFPDSFAIWRLVLQSSDLLRDNILIAVDLPGYGGSDSLSAYGPYEVLETLTEFFIGVRKLYLHEGKKVVAVTHDWGSLIGARLASEAKELADHWIITGGLIPSLTESNARSRVLLMQQMLGAWCRSPLNFRLLKNGLSTLGPALGQLRRSFYTFCFRLPWPLNNTFATFGNFWFLRLLHSLSDGTQYRIEKKVKKLGPKAAGEAMAISAGPGVRQIESRGNDGIQYGASVRKRISDRGMSHKIGVYRDGLFLDEWRKSLEMTTALFEIGSSTSPSLLAGSVPKGALKAPATIILGEFDPAFDQRLTLDNSRDFLVKGSQVIVVKGAGHW